MTPEEASQRLREIVKAAGSTILEECPPSRLRAEQGNREMLLTFDVRIDARTTGTLVHVTATSPTDWEVHVRFRRRQLMDATAFLAAGIAFLGGAVGLAALSPSPDSGFVILAILAGSFLMSFGLLGGVTARARHRQAKRFAGAHGAVLHFGGLR